jgi:hypothetical protein
MNGASSQVDTREAILIELEAVLGTLPGLKGVYRNQFDFPNEALPVAFLLDGSEELAMDVPVPTRKSVLMPPAIFALRPEIYVALARRDTTANTHIKGVYDPVGPEISAYRMMILDAVKTDQTLIQLLTTSGQITFLGSQTDMQGGATLWGRLQMLFEFRYVLF